MPKSRKQAFFNPGHGGRAIFLLCEIYVRDHRRPKLRKRGRKGRVGLLRASTPVYSNYWRPNWTAMCWCLSSPTSNSLLPLHISVLLERCSNVKNYTTETLWGVQLTGELRTRQPQLLFGSDFRTIVIVVALAMWIFHVTVGHEGLWEAEKPPTVHYSKLKLKAFVKNLNILSTSFFCYVLLRPIYYYYRCCCYCVTLYSLQRVCCWKLNGSSRSISFAELNNCCAI